jgi:hypothetical protein
MNKIKIDYRVDHLTPRLISSLKEEIRRFTIKVLNENRVIENRKLTFLSIRISYNQNKIKYALLLQENIANLNDTGILEITEEFFRRIGNRNISIKDLKSIHFHLILN